MRSRDHGVPASPSGSRASHEAAISVASSPEASIHNAAFTPGPWKVGIWNGDKNRKHVVDMLGAPKATFVMLPDRNSMFPPSAVVHSDAARREVEANARLIAAAPRMYEALGRVLGIIAGTFAEGGDIHKEVLAVMAEARGDQ